MIPIVTASHSTLTYRWMWYGNLPHLRNVKYLSADRLISSILKGWLQNKGWVCDSQNLTLVYNTSSFFFRPMLVQHDYHCNQSKLKHIWTCGIWRLKMKVFNILIGRHTNCNTNLMKSQQKTFYKKGQLVLMLNSVLGLHFHTVHICALISIRFSLFQWLFFSKWVQ